MKPLFFQKKVVLLSLMTLIFISCGTYQSVYNNDDGIYDDDRTVVIVKTEKKYKEVEKNYFTKELDRIDKINDGDVFTDVDEYTTFSDYDLVENETDSINTINSNTRISYTDNEPWGYSDNDVVITIDLGYNDWNYWDHYYGYGSHWGYHWRFRHGFYGDYVYAPYYYGYYNNYGYHNFYYYPPYYYHHSNNRYYNYNNNRNYTYGKRSYTSNTSRRHASVNSRIKTSTNRRSTNTRRKVYDTDRKYTTKRGSSTKRSSSNTSSYRSSSSSRRSSSSTRSSSSSSRSSGRSSSRRRN